MRRYMIDGRIFQTWQVRYEHNFFSVPIFVYGTEEDIRAYMISEFGYMGAYSALTEEEYNAVKALHIPIYLAPQVEE